MMNEKAMELNNARKTVTDKFTHSRNERIKQQEESNELSSDSITCASVQTENDEKLKFIVPPSNHNTMLLTNVKDEEEEEEISKPLLYKEQKKPSIGTKQKHSLISSTIPQKRCKIKHNQKEEESSNISNTKIERKQEKPPLINNNLRYMRDPNELCKLLRYLKSLPDNGNQHNVEIDSILKELFKRKIIL